MRSNLLLMVLCFLSFLWSGCATGTRGTGNGRPIFIKIQSEVSLKPTDVRLETYDESGALLELVSADLEKNDSYVGAVSSVQVASAIRILVEFEDRVLVTESLPVTSQFLSLSVELRVRPDTDFLEVIALEEIVNVDNPVEVSPEPSPSPIVTPWPANTPTETVVLPRPTLRPAGTAENSNLPPWVR